MPESEPLQPDKESKSQRKTDMLALQKIGEALIRLPETQLAKIPLEDKLLTAILHAKSLTANEAKRRQLQYIGKIMRHVDPEPIKLALKNIQFPHEIESPSPAQLNLYIPILSLILLDRLLREPRNDLEYYYPGQILH